MIKLLPPHLLESLISEFSTPDTIGVGLVGSFSRGQGHKHSDIDLNFFVPEAPSSRLERYHLYQREGFLVSVKRVGLETQRAELSQVRSAIWAVPGMRQMKILHDPSNQLAALQSEARAFSWDRLEPQIAPFVSYQMMHHAEEAHKILSGLEQQDPSKVTYATLGMGLGMLEAMAVFKKILIESENQYFDLVYRAVGQDSSWCRAHKLAVGWKAGAFERRGIAALQVYWESFLQMQDVVQDEHLEVLQTALQRIQQSGYLQRRV